MCANGASNGWDVGFITQRSLFCLDVYGYDHCDSKTTYQGHFRPSSAILGVCLPEGLGFESLVDQVYN